MTESYDPYANTIAERINGILKEEFFLEDYKVNLQTMKQFVKDAYVFIIPKDHIIYVL